MTGLPTFDSATTRLASWFERLAFPTPSRAASDAPPCPFGQQDIFVTGVNLPWLHYGCDIGANAWHPAGGLAHGSRREDLDDALARLAGTGHPLVRWFLLCDGRSGIDTTSSGTPLGLDRFARTDLDIAAEGLMRHGLRAVFVLFDFLLCAPSRTAGGVQLGGRRSWLAGREARTRLVEQVVAPLAAHLGSSAPVAAWDIFNEPEWVTRGFGGRVGSGAVSHRAMTGFLTEASAALHEISPFPVTTGLASARGLDLVRGVGLDLYQVHWYDRHAGYAPLDLPVTEWRLDRPLLLGEYPTRGSHAPPARIVETARRAGYVGALAWSALSSDPYSAFDHRRTP